MPELPEVETVRQGLLPLIGQRLNRCDVHRRDVIRDLTRESEDPRQGRVMPISLGVSSTIDNIRRHGKQLAIIVSDHRIQRDFQNRCHAIGIHLGMSGQVLITSDPKISPAKHVHAVWTTDSGIRIAFRDPRRFGKVVLHASLESLESDWSKLGPDGERITAKALRAGCSSTSRRIKAALLDQHLIAGIGNIYADESLFDAKINPLIPANELSHEQITLLASSIRKILRRAIKARGSTLRDYRDTSNQSGSAQLLHKVYGRSGQQCTDCQNLIESMQIAHRTSCWCPVCQKTGSELNH